MFPVIRHICEQFATRPHNIPNPSNGSASGSNHVAWALSQSATSQVEKQDAEWRRQLVRNTLVRSATF